MKKYLSLSALICCVLFCIQGKSQIITTIAGRPPVTFGGDGGLATAAFMSNPAGIAIDGTGNMYIADEQNNRVRMVSPAGIISTFAGNGTASFSGDGGLATAASIAYPNCVAIDATGNVYISDRGNNRIRKIDATGIVLTVAGNGTATYSGDGGPAIAASLNAPSGLAFDAAGNLYIADSANNRIRKVSVAGTISTIAGNGTAGFSGDGGPAITAVLNSPIGVATDASGNIYIADMGNHRVRMINPAGNIATIAGSVFTGGMGDGGPATAAGLSGPRSLLVSGGSVYITDRDESVIRAIDPSGIINTVAGSGAGYNGDGGPATAAHLSRPAATAINSAGELFIADKNNHRIRKVTTAGIISTVVGTMYLGDDGPATAAQLYSMADLCVDPIGNIYFTDNYNSRIRKITPAGTITTLAGRFSPGFSGDNEPATDAQMEYPLGITSDPLGNIYFVDGVNRRVRKINTSGIITTVAGGDTGYYTGDGGPATNAGIETWYVTADASGNLYLAEMASGHPRLRMVNAAGIITTIAGDGTMGYSGDGGPATNARFRSIQQIAVDGSGNLYIADAGNHVIRKINTSGIITTFAGNGVSGNSGDGGAATSASLSSPRFISIDNAGSLLISNSLDNVVRSVNSAGIITTIAGTGTQGYTGDGGPATAAQFYFPGAMKMNVHGDIFIADMGNGVIRKITGTSLSTNAPKNSGSTILRPNPVHNELLLSAKSNINSVIVLNPAGQIMLSNTYGSKEVSINVAQLPAGVYAVIINQLEVKTIIKE